MRGTHYEHDVGGFHFGIIPAHAGNTHVQEFADGLQRDHPRTCGEHYGYKLADMRTTGSSPHMRGTPTFESPRRVLGGIIPAHAGNTMKATPVTQPTPGSSPHMRGTPDLWPLYRKLDGIIPAHAGNTRQQGQTKVRQ